MRQSVPYRRFTRSTQTQCTSPHTLTGIVVRFEPVNSHAIIELEVTEEGRARRWVVEGPNLLRLGRLGVGDSLKESAVSDTLAARRSLWTYLGRGVISSQGASI